MVSIETFVKSEKMRVHHHTSNEKTGGRKAAALILRSLTLLLAFDALLIDVNDSCGQFIQLTTPGYRKGIIAINRPQHHQKRSTAAKDAAPPTEFPGKQQDCPVGIT